METTNNLIDRAKAHVLAKSDNDFAMKMKWAASTLTNYRKGRSRMSDEHLVAVCKLLGESPANHAVNLAIERATTEKSRRLWETVKATMMTAASIALLVSASWNVSAVKPFYAQNPAILYIM